LIEATGIITTINGSATTITAIGTAVAVPAVTVSITTIITIASTTSKPDDDAASADSLERAPSRQAGFVTVTHITWMSEVRTKVL
jgi:hypothetical protein